MASEKAIGYERIDGLITVTIDRPPHNVLDIGALEQLEAALAEATADSDAKLLLLTGAGERAFSAGVDIADHTPEKVDRMIETFGDVFRRLEQVPVPTVAAVNGAALGGGCELAIGCDMVIAASHAKIGQPEIKLGVFPPVAAVLMPRLIAPGKARELILGGESLTADEALQCGLIVRVIPKEEFVAGTQAYVARFLGLSRAALVLTKKAMRAAQGRSFLDGLARADEIYLKELMATADAREGLAAYMDKRKPVWQNK
jgi:cyclohexa-1,5-dienecarbonyl-CoA hydratase